MDAPGYKPAAAPEAAVFFIHPTSYLNRARWNGPLDDPEANARADLFLRAQASAFNEVGMVWAPRYRQATFGAFLTNAADAQKALDLAYGDVTAAFDQFLKEAGDRPIILAGHSQGAYHLTRLLRDRIAGTPLAKRIVAAYVIGWPVSRTADLPRLGLPECATASQPGCLLSWQSFGEPADPSMIFDTFDATSGFTGAARKGTAMVCTNPITGTPDAAAPATANLGTLIPDADLGNATIAPGRIPARCSGRGLLLIGTPPISAITCCRATTTMSMITACSGQTSAPTQHAGWRRSGNDQRFRPLPSLTVMPDSFRHPSRRKRNDGCVPGSMDPGTSPG